MATQVKVAIVTGAGTGIGKATAVTLLKAGYRVALAGRRPEPLAAAIAESGVPADQALAVSTDVANPDSVNALFDKVKATWGRLDVIFNNAGVAPPGSRWKT